MAERYLMGVDIGTYESKGVLVATDGSIVRTAVRPHELLTPRQGWAEHDPETAWWNDLCAITRELISESGIDPKSVLAFGCSTVGGCMLPVDRDCRPLRNAILYGIDSRAMKEVTELNKRFSERGLLGSAGKVGRAGNPMSSSSIGPKILWFRNNEPDLYQKTYKIAWGATFLVARLTGEWTVDDYSARGCTPCYDWTTRQWAEDLCEGVVEIGRLPEIHRTTDVAGRITAGAASATGLAQGTPVIVGTIDAPAEAVSVGVVSPGQAMLMYGSTMFYIQLTERQIVDPRLWSGNFVFPDTRTILAGMATTGLLTRWFRDQLAPDLLAIQRETGDNAYRRLSEQAERISPGCEGLVVLPYFSGERTPINDPEARGTFFGLTLSHTRSHLYRAVLEGVGHGIRQHFDILKSIGSAPQEVLAVGGGTKNAAWLQIVSDISGVEQKVPSVTVGASFGDAFLAGLGVGVFSDPAEIRTWVREGRTVRPNPELKGVYDLYHEIYLELYENNKNAMHKLFDMAKSEGR